jgi:hypothetical protein
MQTKKCPATRRGKNRSHDEMEMPENRAKRKPKIAIGEQFRRWRLGELRRLFRDRYGPVLPDDDAGLGDLRELLLLASMALTPTAT